MLVDVARVDEIARGGMKFITAGEREIVVCNCDGRYYAVARRCGHMSGPLELGTLDGTIVTCPMHHVQFDVTTGQALNHPIPHYIAEPLPPQWAQYMRHFGMLMEHTSVCNIRTFPVTVEDGTIKLDVD